MSQSERLLIKEKDYEIQTMKCTVQPKISIHDPLINPPKRKGQKKKATLSKLNPLNRVSKLPEKAIGKASALAQN